MKILNERSNGIPLPVARLVVGCEGNHIYSGLDTNLFDLSALLLAERN